MIEITIVISGHMNDILIKRHSKVSKLEQWWALHKFFKIIHYEYVFVWLILMLNICVDFDTFDQYF